MNNLYFSPLSLSQLLKEKGVAQSSIYYHQKITQDEWKLVHYSYFDGINRESGKVEVDGLEMIKCFATERDDACSAFSVGELPDVFRLVFGEKSVNIFEFFCRIYFSEPATAWKTLERTIRSLNYMDSIENCYLEYVDGYLACTFNHKAGEECLMDRESNELRESYLSTPSPTTREE